MGNQDQGSIPWATLVSIAYKCIKSLNFSSLKYYSIEIFKKIKEESMNKTHKFYKGIQKVLKFSSVEQVVIAVYILIARVNQYILRLNKLHLKKHFIFIILLAGFEVDYQ